MKYEFLKPAEEEFREAASYYNRQQKGLGHRFMKEVSRMISYIVENPEAWALISPNARRCLLKKFPYALIYQILDDKILIIAVMHLSRRPDYWEKRF